MFGVQFFNHPDLRRILTDYGFIGFPLRKDFPLIGYFSIQFSHINKQVKYVLALFTQEYRKYVE